MTLVWNELSLILTDMIYILLKSYSLTLGLTTITYQTTCYNYCKLAVNGYD